MYRLIVYVMDNELRDVLDMCERQIKREYDRSIQKRRGLTLEEYRLIKNHDAFDLFGIGAELFYMHDNKVCSGFVKSIEIRIFETTGFGSPEEVRYHIHYFLHKDDCPCYGAPGPEKLFVSKAELIDDIRSRVYRSRSSYEESKENLEKVGFGLKKFTTRRLKSTGWYMHDNFPVQQKIDEIKITIDAEGEHVMYGLQFSGRDKYSTETRYFSDAELYLTADELIDTL